MATGKPAPAEPELYDRVRDILESARLGVARTVNTAQVVANWLIGREIVEEEQRGRRRAGYGEELLQALAGRLKVEFGAGYSVDKLELFRRFYAGYPQLLPEPAISDAVRRKSERMPDAPRRKSGPPIAASQILHAVRGESGADGRD